MLQRPHTANLRILALRRQDSNQHSRNVCFEHLAANASPTGLRISVQSKANGGVLEVVWNGRCSPCCGHILSPIDVSSTGTGIYQYDERGFCVP